MISKDRLWEIQRSISQRGTVTLTSFQCGRLSMVERLIEECGEDWMPIADAPWGKPLLVYYPTMEEGLRQRVICRRVDWDASIHKPTHYKLLSADPK